MKTFSPRRAHPRRVRGGGGSRDAVPRCGNVARRSRDLADPHALTIGWSPWHNGAHNGLTVHINNNRSTDAGSCVYCGDGQWRHDPVFYY